MDDAEIFPPATNIDFAFRARGVRYRDVHKRRHRDIASLSYFKSDQVLSWHNVKLNQILGVWF